jgi:CDP-4-dehydro-6-deoxyglucose reductase
MCHQVIVQPSGHEFSVVDGDTILEAAIANGINLPYSCRNGACGACKGKVLEGRVDYGDHQVGALLNTEKENGLALFCCATPLTDLVIECREASMLNGIRPRILPVRVQRMEKLAHDVMALYLKLPSNERLQFLPGQYIEFLLKDGQRRAFSIANAPHDDELLQLHVRWVPNGKFTSHVFEELQEKTIMRMEAPLGSFYLREESHKPIIFVAGGTGFAPIKAMVEHMLHHGLKRKVCIYWGARAQEDIYLPQLPEAWQRAHANLQFIPVLSEPQASDDWQGRTGLVHQAVLDDIERFGDYQVYCCGSPAMVDIARTTFIEQGLPAEEFFADAFTFFNATSV